MLQEALATYTGDRAESKRRWSALYRRSIGRHSIDEAVFLSDRVVVMTVRPGGVREILDIELPRRRTMHMREHPKFVEYVGRIREVIFTKA